MTPHSDGTRRDLTILQLNLRRSEVSLLTVLLHAQDKQIDIILVQDPPTTVTSDMEAHMGFQFFAADTLPHPLSGVFVRHVLNAWPCPLMTDRAAGIFLSWGHQQLAVISGYVQPVSGDGLQDITNLSTAMRTQTSYLYIGMDANGHSPLWGPPFTPTNHQGRLIEDFITTANLQLLNVLKLAIPKYINGMDNGI